MPQPSDGAEQTTAAHLDQLLGRALNSFELSEELLITLGTALAHRSAFHSSHHCATQSRRLVRETYRHEYLLADGGSLDLWEVVHNTGPDGVHQCELYAERDEAQLAAARLRKPDGSPAFLDDRPEPAFEIDLTAGLSRTTATEPPSYLPDNSADHARRVLRRAENGDRPGDATGRLLRGSIGHKITRIASRRCRLEERAGRFALYEHAFLLADGREVSLWEAEHTMTADGQHMCEVYLSEESALDAMERRNRVR